MNNLYTFFQSLIPGDVITTTKTTKKRDDEPFLVMNNSHHRGWNKYARVTRVSTIKGKDANKSVIGVSWEGIDPTVFDCCIHPAVEDDKKPTNLRIANGIEHKAFIEEYIKNRMELAEHDIAESQSTIKRCRAKTRELKKIAEHENINTDKLLKSGGTR